MWFIIWILPAIVSVAIGTVVGYWGAGIGLALVWVGFCIYRGSMILGQREFALIERLGKYHTVFFCGWHIRVIGVDTIRNQGFMRAESLHMYSDENGRTSRAMMDFTDASAPIDATFWYHICDKTMRIGNTFSEFQPRIGTVKGSIISLSGADRSVIHPMNGAPCNSMASGNSLNIAMKTGI